MRLMSNALSKCALIILSTALLAPSSWAETRQLSEANQQAIEQSIARLNLTDAQKEKVKPIFENSAETRQKILQEAGLTEGKKPTRAQLRQLRKPLKAARQDTKQQLSSILNEEQMQELEKIQQEGREKLKKRLRERNG